MSIMTYYQTSLIRASTKYMILYLWDSWATRIPANHVTLIGREIMDSEHAEVNHELVLHEASSTYIIIGLL